MDAAYEVLRHANVILAEIEHLDATLAAFDEGRGGLVRVGSFGSGIAGLVVPASAALSESHPGLTLEIEELEPPEALVSLARDELDLVSEHSRRAGVHHGAFPQVVTTGPGSEAQNRDGDPTPRPSGRGWRGSCGCHRRWP